MDTLETRLRLDGLSDHLGLGKRWRGHQHEPDAVKAAVERVRATVNLGLCVRSEDVAGVIAEQHQVRFAEVRSQGDIESLERFYLHERKELSFAWLRDELANPRVEALLIQRRKADPDAPDKWVAVLNSTRTADRAFWNMFHELAHRIAEPPQLVLPITMRRETTDVYNTLERLMDRIAAEIAFLPEVIGPALSEVIGADLTISAIQSFKDAVAPSASLLSAINAVVTRHPLPAVSFTASMATRVSGGLESMALRVQPQGRSPSATKDGFIMLKNMRVPASSSVSQTFQDGVKRTEFESMTEWRTSSGAKLKWNAAIVSTIRLGAVVYSTMQIVS